MSEQKLLSKEQIVAMCEKLEEIASDQNNEETTICVFPEGVNYPALKDGALGFPVDFTTHLHFPFGVFTYPRPVPLVKARAMLIDAFRSRLYLRPHLGQ